VCGGEIPHHKKIKKISPKGLTNCPKCDIIIVPNEKGVI
jgi:hypothetical protein